VDGSRSFLKFTLEYDRYLVAMAIHQFTSARATLLMYRSPTYTYIYDKYIYLCSLVYTYTHINIYLHITYIYSGVCFSIIIHLMQKLNSHSSVNNFLCFFCCERVCGVFSCVVGDRVSTNPCNSVEEIIAGEPHLLV